MFWCEKETSHWALFGCSIKKCATAEKEQDINHYLLNTCKLKKNELFCSHRIIRLMDLSRDDRYSKTCVKRPLKNRQDLGPRQNKDLNDNW